MSATMEATTETPRGVETQQMQVPGNTSPAESMIAPAVGPAYDGFYFRNNLRCDGTVPSAGPYDLCPDIVSSDSPIANAQAALSTPASWNTFFTTDPVPGTETFLYVRGLNGSSEAVTNVPLSLYAAPSELILFPSTWKNQPLQTARGSETVGVSAQAGAIGVGSDAFVWNPPPLNGDSDFYALVAQSTSTIPTVSAWTDMSALLTQDLGLGFRNTLYISGGAPSWLHRFGLHVPVSFATSGQVMLTLTASGMTGATIGVLADAYGSDKQIIAILPQEATQDRFATGVQITLDPGFSASVAVQYWSGNAKPASGSTITLSASYVVPQTDLVAASSRGLIDSTRDRFLQQAHAAVQPQSTTLLGSVTFIVS